jgi:hypothetical protein
VPINVKPGDRELIGKWSDTEIRVDAIAEQPRRGTRTISGGGMDAMDF